MSLNAIKELNDQPQVTVQVLGPQGASLLAAPVESIKQELAFSQSITCSESVSQIVEADAVEVSDGEIMDGEEPIDVINMNKMQQIAAEALRS